MGNLSSPCTSSGLSYERTLFVDSKRSSFGAPLLLLLFFPLDIVTIKNVSKLPLDIDLSVKPPFAIVQKQSTYKILPEEEHLCCCIRYNECDLNIPNIMNEMGHQSRTFIDYLTLKPVEPLRKGPLHFFQDINKIKMAFNLTHTIEERLEDQDVMKLQIVFDTTKHLTLKSRVYCDLMRIKFRGHKNKVSSYSC